MTATPLHLVLASKSPRRRSLLQNAGLSFEVRVSGVDEDEHFHGSPRAIALKTALAKAEAVCELCPAGTLVLAADTMVVKDERIFTKPEDREDAKRMLRELSGVQHQVVTGVALGRAGGETLVDCDWAGVQFNPLSDELIEAYVASGQADDKAGSYGIQGLGSEFVARVQGDITCVIGLPMLLLGRMLEELTGQQPLAGLDLAAVARAAFPEIGRLPAQCLDGISARPCK